MSTTGGAAAVICAIGPKGPMVVRPEGRTDGTPECPQRAYSRGGPDGPITVKPKGLTGLKARQPATVCTSILPVLKVPANKRAQSEHRIWPVPDSHLRIQSSQLTGTANQTRYVGLWAPASNPPSNKRARQTTSTPTTAPARLALRSNVLSGLAEKFANAGLVECKANGLA